MSRARTAFLAAAAIGAAASASAANDGELAEDIREAIARLTAPVAP